MTHQKESYQQYLGKLDVKQKGRLILPRGDLKLEDGQTLRRIIGYDIRKLNSLAGIAVMNKVTYDGVLESGGWQGANRLIVSAGVEETNRFGPLLHVSMSYPDHDPSWELIKLVRAAFFPGDIDVVMVLPKAGDYINVHSHCFHLWQAPESWDML